MADARQVAEAVQRFADTGQGTVLPGDGGVYLLFADGYVAVLLIDRDTVYVDRVRHA